MLSFLVFLFPCDSLSHAGQNTQPGKPGKTVTENDSLVKKIMFVHPVSNEFTKTIAEGVKEVCGFWEIKHIDALMKSAGSFRAKENIAELVRAYSPDLVCAVGTDVLVLLQEIEDIPIVYVHAYDIPEHILAKKNITGLSNLLGIEEQLNLIRQIIPQKKILGVIYSEKTEKSVREAEKAAKKNNMTLITVKLAKPYGRNKDRLLHMLGNADAVWIIPNSVTWQIRYFVSHMCIIKRLPLFTSLKNMLKGELMSVSPDPYETGRQAGAIIMRILFSKEKPGDIPMAYLSKGIITINDKTAKALGIKTDKINIPKGWKLYHRKY